MTINERNLAVQILVTFEKIGYLLDIELAWVGLKQNPTWVVQTVMKMSDTGRIEAKIKNKNRNWVTSGVNAAKGSALL